MDEIIFQDAVSELTPHYPFLMDESLVGEFESCINYKKNVKEQLEKMCHRYEMKIIDDEVRRMP